ncbi:putative nitrate reductase [Vibrio virus VPMCC5]|nr:putative nitrate reductase [Vibrio virus VPMCC5]
MCLRENIDTLYCTQPLLCIGVTDCQSDMSMCNWLTLALIILIT